jgi:predicted ATP-grasp superfamily ATP-dependent carboligase
MNETVEDLSVYETGRECLTRLGYTGKAFVQVKKDPRNGQPYVFEINCRYPASNYLQVVAGVNMPRAAYRSILSQPVEKESPTIGVRWAHVSNDFKALLDYRKLGEWTVLSWFRSYRKVRGLAVWSFVDLRPGLRWFAKDVMMMFRKVVRRLMLRRN